ncbi:polyunsaturated fatty acid 5-lipoxygenase-like [Pocillopora verrucosa]|uniref:polyunsaturated fatty acid 5-lipoxygenase-like n=1 Tax=Pocillopora verrucosa TaxID=203993 RepID=UPI00333FA588
MLSKITLFFILVSQTKTSDTVDKGALEDSEPQLFQSEGCYGAKSIQDAGVNLGRFSSSDIGECAELALKKGFAEFGLLHGGLCKGGDNLQGKVSETSVTCRDGVGGEDSVELYSLKPSAIACPIESSDKASKKCQSQRQQETAKTREDYELDKGNDYLPIPRINKNIREVFLLLKKDLLDNHWISLYNQTIYKNFGLFRILVNLTRRKDIDYNKIYKFFVAGQRDPRFVLPEDQKFFRFAFEDTTSPFKDVSDLSLWRDDDVFTDQRLAGMNPMAIQRVSLDSGRRGGVSWRTLLRKLNPTFDWQGAIQDVLGKSISMYWAIRRGYIYVVHYPLYDGLNPITDDPFGELMEANSPIAIFASKPSHQRLPNRLKPVAIQINSSPDSPVYTPEDSQLWQMAKHVLQVADYAQTQIVEHLFKIHLYMEPICVCVHRRLSKLHPLHQLLKHHCRGLLGTNALGYPFLMAPGNGSIDKLMLIGRQGAMTMMRRAYNDLSWEKTDFLVNIKKRGLGDKEKLPYFPYRDDGLLIYHSLSNMVKEFVGKYYRSNREVMIDKELQDFARDVSVGSGKVKGFPTKITSKFCLASHLVRIMWMTSAQHSVINYPVNHYGALTFNSPTKLYKDKMTAMGHYGFTNLPRSFTCMTQSALSMTLAAMHYDRLLDFVPKFPEENGKSVLQKYHDYLDGEVTSKITQRNKQRFKEGHLPYPYLLPAWIANSIHT